VQALHSAILLFTNVHNRRKGGEFVESPEELKGALFARKLVLKKKKNMGM